MNFEDLNIKSTEKRPIHIAAYVAVGVLGGIGTLLTVLCLPFVAPAFRRICLPYVPATTQQVENVLEALKGRSGTLVDLGSGDGRIVLSAAKNGFLSTGVELNPWLVCYSKIMSFRMGLSSKAKFQRCNLWKFDLRLFNNVVIFGVDEMMAELEQKFSKELNENACIIACRFPLPNKNPTKVIGVGIDKVWVYKN